MRPIPRVPGRRTLPGGPSHLRWSGFVSRSSIAGFPARSCAPPRRVTTSARFARGGPAERALLEELDLRRPRIERAVARSDYRAAFVDIAGLRAAVDRFFTEVFVMAEDVRIRNARLKLMAELRDLILHLADISEIIP